MQTIYLDISNKGVVPTIYAKQGDIGRKVQVIFTDSGIPYEIPENAELSVWYDGDSGDGNYTDIGDKSAIVVENNKVTFELITQMLNNDGEGIVCLIMNVGEEQIGSWNIHYLCEKVPGFGSEGASSYFTAFSESVNKLKDTDKTLTKEGYPADAKATGDKIDKLTAEDVGAAPSGYGLGEIKGKDIKGVDLNTIFENGWYSFNGEGSLINGPDGCAGNYAILEVSTAPYHDSPMTCVQTLTIGSGGLEGYQLQRAYNGAMWLPWCWINPPMLLGREYCTTERYKGKPVYAKCISYTTSGVIGGFEAGCVEVVIPHGCSNFGELVGCVGKIEAQPLPTISRTGGLATVHVVDNNNITIRLYNTGLNGTFTFELRHTKV